MEEVLPYWVDRMRLEDIEQVVAIDRVAFPTPWSANAYRHEIVHNEAAHYFVALLRKSPSPAPPVVPSQGWRAWLTRRLRSARSPRYVVGYSGFWLMVDEAHISTIAVRPDFRRRGIGELLMLTMLEEAIRLQAVTATLEVRVSNVAAQQLYRKYGFDIVGRRRGYYSDNREDALIMTVYGILSPEYQARLSHLKARLHRRLVEAAPMSQEHEPQQSPYQAPEH